MKSAKGGTLTVTSGVSERTSEGFVSLYWNGEHGQLTPDEARTFALSIMDAAGAAEFDAGCIKLLGIGRESAMLLHALRAQRGDASYSLRTILHSDGDDASGEDPKK